MTFATAQLKAIKEKKRREGKKDGRIFNKGPVGGKHGNMKAELQGWKMSMNNE